MSNNIVIAAIVAGAVGFGAGYALFSGLVPETVEKETVTSAPAGAGTLDEVRARGKLKINYQKNMYLDYLPSGSADIKRNTKNLIRKK